MVLNSDLALAFNSDFMESRMKLILGVIIVVVIVVVSVTAVTVLQKKPSSTPTAKSLTAASSTKLAYTGQSVNFFTLSSQGTSGITNVTWLFGDGQRGTGLNVSHKYTYPGFYLVELSWMSGGKLSTNLARLFPVEVLSSTTGVSTTTLSQQTAPVILFNKTVNTNAPLFTMNETASAQGSYLQPPTAVNWSISQYSWYVAGKTGSGTTFNFTASNPGVYPLFLNITTKNSTSSIVNTVIQTVVFEPSNVTTGVLLGPGSVINPTVITDAEIVPGGPFSLDPQIDWETVGLEVIRNVYETLVSFNGSSTTSFIPVLASQIPTMANGGISSNSLNWTFTIRSNATFADGNKVTAFDAYFSFVRELLFATGSPGTGGYTLAQALLPGYATYTPGFNSYANITKALTYSNSSNTVTFHLFKPVPYFLSLLADTPSSVMEYSWAAAHGSGLAFTPAGFTSYMNQAIAQHYNTFIQWNSMGSGPFTVSSVQLGESITLSPNPHYNPPAYGFPKSNYTVVIDYVKAASTAVLMLKNGQADIVSNLPTSSLPSAIQAESTGQASIYTFSTMTTYFYPFNFNINTTMLKTIGSQYTVPANYFANLDVRKAFTDTFNYTQFLNDILGNAKFGINLGQGYVGLLPPGMLGYKPFNQWSNAPAYDLAEATSLLYASGQYNTTVNIPIFVSSGDVTNYAAVSMWAQALHTIDSHITVTPYYITFSQMIGYIVANQNPMPIYSLGWGTSIPDPINMIPPMYNPGGFYLDGDGVPSASAVSSMGHPHQAQNFSLILNLSNQAQVETNVTLRANLYQEANQIAVNLTLYLYTYIPNGMWIYQTWLKGVNHQENPVVGGEVDTLFCYLTK